MKVIATDCMYLAGREGQFTPNGESESIKYQNAEFFQKGSDASIKLALSNDLKPENFESMQFYDLEIDISSGSRLRARVVGFTPSYGSYSGD